MNDINNKIKAVIQSAFCLPVSETDINPDDIPAITRIAYNQNILSIVVEGIKNLGRLDLLTDDLLKGQSKSVFDYTQRMVSLDEISNAFECESIQFIPLKGSVLRDLYPKPEMRTSSDIDILIHTEDLVKAIQVLESRTSFRYYKKERHDAHLKNKYVHLELHFSFEYSIEKIDASLCNPWDHVMMIADSYRCVFTPEYNLFYIVSHAAKHFIQNGGIGIRPLLDIYLLRTNSDFDDDSVMTLCDNAGILDFYKTCCKLIDIWFNGDSYDDVSAIFEDFVIKGGVFGSKHLKIVSNKRNDFGKRYVARRIFKNSDEIKNYFPKCRKYPFLVPFYQVVRWIRMLRIKSTSEYFSQFKHANSIDENEIEKYDKLMKAMGF